MASPYRIDVSPDGRNVYVASGASDAITVFSRNVLNGSLTQLPGTAGCVSEDGTGGQCADGRGLDLPYDLDVSPDGKFLYAASLGSNAVTTFARDSATGALTQLVGETGCIAAAASSGCGQGRGLAGAGSITVSQDGKSLYVAADGGTPAVDGSVAIFSRDAGSGALTQLAGQKGCISETGYGGMCSDDHGLDGATRTAVSGEGHTVYVASLFSDAISVFSRDSATGALTQVSGQGGCVSETGSGGACSDGRGLDYLHDVVVSPDDRHVYGAAVGSNAISAFARNATTGALTQLDGVAGCTSATGVDGCATGHDLEGPIDLVISPDGRRLYAAAYYASAITVFARGLASGVLAQVVDPGALRFGWGRHLRAGEPAAQRQLTRDGPGGTSIYAVAPTDDALTWLTITPQASSPPQCVDATAVVEHDSSLVIALACTEPDGDVVTRSIVDGPVHGTLGPIDPGSDTVMYTPVAAYSGPDAFRFKATDVDGSSAPATITLQVKQAPPGPDPVGSPPQCSDGAAVVEYDTSLPIPLQCTEPDGDVVTRSIVDGPTHGVLGVIDQGAGTVTYMPAAGYSGPDAFRFKATDVDGGSSSATITLQVKSAPVVPDPDPGPDPDPPANTPQDPLPVGDAVTDPGPTTTGNEPVAVVPVTPQSLPPIPPKPTVDPPKPLTPSQVLAAVMKPLRTTATCVSQKSFTVRLAEPKNAGIKKAYISLAGRQKTKRGGKVAGTYTWKKLPRGKVTLTIKLAFNSGQSAKKILRYSVCRRR